MDPEDFKVTVNDQSAMPTASPVLDPAAPMIDAKGRRLVLRDLTLLEEQDLIAAMPANHSAQQLVLGRALMAARVASIDGERSEIPLSALQYRAMLQRVGKEGLAVVYGTLPKATDGDDRDTVELAKN